ncbi:MAG: DMT family transporter [Pyrinomonadaceae bacterium]
MPGYILLAMLNGVVIGVSRAINGRLSIEIGPFKASFWNHLVGFLFLTTVLIGMGSLTFSIPSCAPAFTYLGGFFGALFVAVNSYVLPRIGAIKTVLLVISGQIVTGVLIDYQRGAAVSTLAQFLGVAIIILGVYLARTSGSRRDKEDSA